MNEHGTIALPRLQMMLDRLAEYEKERFEEEFADQNWYKGKQTKDIQAMEKARKRGKLGAYSLSWDRGGAMLIISHHQRPEEAIRRCQGIRTETPIQAIS